MSKAKKKSKKPSPKPKKTVEVKRSPRQTSLPGMQDAKIAAIESVALDYDDIKKQRMELSKQESDLKQSLITLMHKAKKKQYIRNGISVILVVEEETVKVKVKSDDDEESEVPTEAEIQASEEAEEEDPGPVEQEDPDAEVVEDGPPGYDEETEETEEEAEQEEAEANS